MHQGPRGPVVTGLTWSAAATCDASATPPGRRTSLSGASTRQAGKQTGGRQGTLHRWQAGAQAALYPSLSPNAPCPHHLSLFPLSYPQEYTRKKISDFLHSHTAYELIPESGKVVVLDMDLPVRQAFHALHEQVRGVCVAQGVLVHDLCGGGGRGGGENELTCEAGPPSTTDSITVHQ